MLTVSIKGKVIPVPKDFSVRLTWKSPATDFEKIPEGFGVGLSFKMNEYTRPIFGNPERFSKSRTRNDQKFEGFEIRYSSNNSSAGVLMMAGTLTIDSFSKGNYEGTLEDQVGVLSESQRDRDILTLPPFTKDIPWVNSPNYNPENDAYCCFPIINVKFFKEKGAIITIPATADNEEYKTEALSYGFMRPTVGAKVNVLNPDNTVKCNASIFQIEQPGQIPAITVVSPFFFLRKVIKDALKSVGFYIEQNAMDAIEEFKRLCIYNNFDITKTEFVTDNMWEVESNPDADFTGIEEQYTAEPLNSGYWVKVYKRDYTGNISAKNHLPKIELGNLLLSTQNFLNICLHFRPDNSVNIFSRDALLTGRAVDLDKYFIGSWAIGEKKDVALKFVHDNDDNDLIYTERFQDIEDRITDIKDAVENQNALLAIANPKEGEIRYVKYSNNWMEYRMITIDSQDGTTKDVLGWAEFSVGFGNGWYNRGNRKVEEIKTSWSTCWGNDQVTIVSQQGNMNSWKAKAQPFSPRLLIYKGNNLGGNESDTLSLDYEKAQKGILSKYWKFWAPFWANRLEVSGEFNFPISVLRYLVYNICKKYRTREGEFMIREMSCELFVDRVGVTEITGYKVE